MIKLQESVHFISAYVRQIQEKHKAKKPRILEGNKK